MPNDTEKDYDEIFKNFFRKLPRRSKTIETFSKLYTMVGLLLGACWVVYTFNYQKVSEANRQIAEQQQHDRENLSRLQMTVRTTVSHFYGDQKLLVINVDFKNLGINRIAGQGCDVRVWKSKQQAVGHFVNWNLSERERVDNGINLFKKYPTWIIKPGIEYHESECLLLNPGLYRIMVQMYGDLETITEFQTVFIE